MAEIRTSAEEFVPRQIVGRKSPSVVKVAMAFQVRRSANSGDVIKKRVIDDATQSFRFQSVRRGL